MDNPGPSTPKKFKQHQPNEDTSLNAFVVSLSPLKESKKHVPYFDMELQSDAGSERAVCFTKARYDLFKRLNKSDNEGVSLKRFKKSNNDILITDYSQVKKIAMNRQRPEESIQISEIATSLAECALFQRINIKGIITAISEVKTSQKDDGNAIQFKTAIVSDSSGHANITIFGDLVNQVKNDEAVLLTHIQIARFKKDRLLKTTDITKLKKVTIEENIDTTITNPCQCKFVTMNMSSLDTKTICPSCSTEIQSYEEIVLCNNCSNMSSIDECQKKSSNVLTVLKNTSTGAKYNVSIPLDMLKIIDVPVSNKVMFVKKLLSETLTITLNMDNMTLQDLELFTENLEASDTKDE
ncbi:uncharacterized protein LOC130647301 [Hydractinia symbiolongicarpus]|uniref:uncharacterized protein LOC130647301 n=1 Tax=Hydractinia symbiolongicarpus TaxID=13093 RepID=UPI00254C3D27|nr:uncharacterized protein LOC130647301 [Hydractinia symbiolongicarpus]